MSISAAMYAAVTGLSALSTGMQVISNNIANVNTVGFKAGRTNFEDLISQDYWSNGKIQQIGRGVKVASVQQMFTQGSFMNSAQDTDMAITGEGFFQVRDRVTNTLMYTRAGNFTFDADGNLETPAGYILQGWELSVPKPGEDPVRLGSPVDVKVVILNAPPVETTQIKVVANLNADDSSAYIYSQSAWSSMYADQLAKTPAETARVAAEASVYNNATQSAYVSTSTAFNTAYVDYMASIGYTPTSPGATTFEKIEQVNPTTAELKAAEDAASAAAWTWLNINGTYPITSNSTLFTTAYNTEYRNYMINTLGYTEEGGQFFKLTQTKANTTQVDLAASAGKAAAEVYIAANGLTGFPGGVYTSYPSGNAAVDTEYANAYKTAMGTNFLSGVDEYRTNAASSAQAVAAAEAAGLAANGGVTPPSVDPVDDLKYYAAYAEEMVRRGYTFDASYVSPNTVPTVVIYPSTAELNTATNLAETATGSWASLTPEADKLEYAATYAASLKGAGYTVDTTLATALALPDPATAWEDSLGNPTDISTGSGNSEEAAANTAGLAANGNIAYVAGRGDASDYQYLAAYTNYLKGQGYELTTAVITNEPVNTNFTRVPTAAEITNAETLASIKANQVAALTGIAWTNLSSSTDDAASLAYLTTYISTLTSNGATTSYTAPPAVNDTLFTKSPTAQQIIDAKAAAKNYAVTNASMSTSYDYPTGITAWDTAYETGYDNYLTGLGLGYTYYSESTHGQEYTWVQRTNPTSDDQTLADNAALKAATAAAIGPATTGYELSSIDPGFATAYNNAYRTFLTSPPYSYTQVASPPLGGPYFEKSQTTYANAETYEAARTTAKTLAALAAKNAGQAAYDAEYNTIYNQALNTINTQYAPWQLEGLGFAGAWDGTDTTSPIDAENYTHANPWTIYDSLGKAHTLMVYYQPNPHMENVWDYIITCDPTEDARKDLNNTVVMNGATFAGVIQKGKITFSSDGPDGHGGLVKDIEAQNIDMSKTAAATLSNQVSNSQNPATSSSMNYANLGGYFTGSPVFSAATGTLVDSQRQYTIKWQNSLGTVPDVSGFTWTDTAGNTGTIPVYDKNYTGPYPFGSGLNVSFAEGGHPMSFTSGDTVSFTAHSEQIGWTNLTPNAEGYFDFEVAFVQSASMALHPPYPSSLPTITQSITLDMGARNPNGQNGSWILDAQGTTQYASESINIFSSQDGYPAGSLQRVSIGSDGILTGIYTNGRQQPLYQIGLTRFLNPWGLAKLGDNVYMETRWSGTGTINPPGYGGTGTIRANFLEQSNTDLADEIVNMIVTQRGFQANSKVVTTTDTMLAEVIEMKR
ncbi:MAG: flagellar hook-basal body complex protein [Deltaproteobacteria bacterium]|jgi:flagellar hook-basal body protein|nr:flagellar hook-basal body complex protein [Deltaproteobacteria bacterium]